MGLSLLTPLALLLAGLVVLPLLAHLSRQTPRERRAFGAMLLLQRVVKRLRRRRRVKDRWLLLLRALAVLALILGIAGPRWAFEGDAPVYGGTGRVIAVVDRSMSMTLTDGGTTLLQRARSEASRTVRQLPEGTLVGAISFGSEAVRLTASLTGDTDRVADRLAAVEPSSDTSNLRAALHEARRLLAGEPGEVLVFTDEAGPRLVAEAMPELASLVESGSAVIPRPVHAVPPRNIAVVSTTYGAGIEGGQVQLRVANYGPASIEVACTVTLPDGAEIPIFIDLPPEGEAEERITVPREALGGVGEARCVDPDLSADDARYFHLPRVGASRVLVVDGDPGDTPIRSEVYFLERALAPWGGLRTGVRPDVTPPVGLLELEPERHRVVFLANVGDPRAFGPRLTEFVRKGGSLVISMGDNVTADRFNASLGGILPAPLRKARALATRGEPGVALALPDPSHDFFAPFSRAGRAGFGRVRTHRVMTFEPYDDSANVQTLLRYEGGVPALVEHRVGAGRVVVWTSSMDLGWTNLPFQTVFMPLVQRLVSSLGGEAGGGAARLNARVGEPVALALPDLALEPEVLGPAGDAVRSRIEGSQLLFTPEQAGAYEVRIESAPPLAWVAVNTPPEESDVRRYDSIREAEADIAPELFRRYVDLSPWMFGLAVLLMLAQALMALRGGP